MSCDFTSFSKVFQSYQGDGRMILKGLCNGTPFTVTNVSHRAGLELTTDRSADQRLTHLPTGAPPHYNRLGKTILIMGHNVRFYDELKIFHPQITPVALLTWSP